LGRFKSSVANKSVVSMATGGFGLLLLQTQQVAIHQIGADVARKKVQVLALGEQAVRGQMFAVVKNDVGVLHSGVVQMRGGCVQPGHARVHKQDRKLLAHVHQIQRVGHDGDAGPCTEIAEGRCHVCAVVQDVNLGDGVRRHQAAGADALLLAIVVQGGGQNAAVPTVGDKGFENAVLDHALDGADRQAEHFGGLARAEVVLWVLGCFHGLVP